MGNWFSSGPSDREVIAARLALHRQNLATLLASPQVIQRLRRGPQQGPSLELAVVGHSGSGKSAALNALYSCLQSPYRASVGASETNQQTAVIYSADAGACRIRTIDTRGTSPTDTFVPQADAWRLILLKLCTAGFRHLESMDWTQRPVPAAANQQPPALCIARVILVVVSLQDIIIPGSRMQPAVIPQGFPADRAAFNRAAREVLALHGTRLLLSELLQLLRAGHVLEPYLIVTRVPQSLTCNEEASIRLKRQLTTALGLREFGANRIALLDIPRFLRENASADDNQPSAASLEMCILLEQIVASLAGLG